MHSPAAGEGMKKKIMGYIMSHRQKSDFINVIVEEINEMTSAAFRLTTPILGSWLFKSREIDKISESTKTKWSLCLTIAR